MDDDNGTALGWPRQNRRAPTQYNPKSIVPNSQWVSNQQSSVAGFVLDSALDDTLSMDLWREIQGMLAYQTVDNRALTYVDPRIFKSKKGTDQDKPSLIEALISPQSKQWTESMI